jgi:tetratricopeptide (TPR) repeat protein
MDPDVPSPAQFDHEITAVRLGKDKDQDLTWLDTTTEVAPYGLILYQLRNKQALIASDDSNAGLRRTPTDSPVKNLLVMKLDGKFTEAGAFDVKMDLTAPGDSDLPLRAMFRRISEADWQRVLQVLSSEWGLAGDVSGIHLDSLEDTTKLFHLIYRYHKDDYFVVPNPGVNFRILPPLQLPRVAGPGTKRSAEPLDVGPAAERTYRAHIEFPSNYSIQTPPTVQMTRDYGEYSSSYNLNKNVLEAERRMVLKVNELASRRVDYDSFHNVTSNNEQQVLTCRVTKVAGTAMASARKVSGTPQEMRKAGTAALQRRDFGAAVDLLSRAVQQDADLKDAWDDLGLAYAGMNNHEEAIRAFRKQIELDPFHGQANRDLAGELQQQKKFDDAVAAYRKQLEINPGDKLSHKDLGLLLVQLNHQAEAQTELEAAAALPPDDPEIKMALAQVYVRTGNPAKGELLMKSVTGATATTATSDIYASALRDDVDQNQTVRDARQTLSDIGDQFDSGEFDRLGPSAFSAMNLVALAWARIGWAKYLQGETLEALQFLNSSWLLTQSGTVANRLARLLEKEGQRDQARRTYALAVAAGGADVEASRQAVGNLSADPSAAGQEIAQVPGELLRMRTVQLPAITAATASARFALVFDGSSQPERAEFIDGDAALKDAGRQLQQKDYPVKFPDVSSVKIVRHATLSCSSSKCAVVLLPPEAMNPAVSNATPGPGPKR